MDYFQERDIDPQNFDANDSKLNSSQHLRKEDKLYSSTDIDSDDESPTTKRRDPIQNSGVF